MTTVMKPQPTDVRLPSAKLDAWVALLSRSPAGRTPPDAPDRRQPLPTLAAVGRFVAKLIDFLLADFVAGASAAPAGRERSVRRRISSIHDSLDGLLATCLLATDGAAADSSKPESRHDPQHRRAEIIDVLFNLLPRIRADIGLDLQATYDGDPACRSVTEAALCYPGPHALAVHRVAHELYKLRVPLLPRMMNEVAHRQTGIDIHPGARIGRSCCIDHGTGVVIGETTVIGDHCRLYQGVTLGAQSCRRDDSSTRYPPTQRHPTLQDHVTVYAEATILGGQTVIGAGSVIGGGVFLTKSTPVGSIVTNAEPERIVRPNPQRVPPSFSI